MKRPFLDIIQIIFCADKGPAAVGTVPAGDGTLARWHASCRWRQIRSLVVELSGGAVTAVAEVWRVCEPSRCAQREQTRTTVDATSRKCDPCAQPAEKDQ